MPSKWLLYALLVAGCLLLLAGCGNGARAGGGGEVFYRGTDDTGAEVVVAEKPHRIVSLGRGMDEILLGIAPPEQIAGLTSTVDDPGISCMTEEARAVSVKLKDRSPERVAALDPDLVLAIDGIPKELVDSLRDLGIPVFVSRTPNNLDDIFARIETVGRLIGQEENAAALIAEKRALLADVERRVGDIPEEERPIVVAFAFSGDDCGLDGAGRRT